LELGLLCIYINQPDAPQIQAELLLQYCENYTGDKSFVMKYRTGTLYPGEIGSKIWQGI